MPSIMFVPTWRCDRNCNWCADDSCPGGAHFEEDVLRLEAMRYLYEYSTVHKRCFRHGTISGGGETLMSPFTPLVAAFTLGLTEDAGLVTSGPANDIEAARFEKVQYIFKAGRRGIVMPGTEQEQDLHRQLWGTCTVSCYDNQASQRRVELALDLAKVDISLRVLYYPFCKCSWRAEVLHLAERFDWLNELYYRHGYFFTGFYDRIKPVLPQASLAEVMSGKMTEMNWEKISGRFITAMMYSQGVMPLYFHPIKDIWGTIGLQSIKPYGRAAGKIPSKKLGGCAILAGIDRDQICVTPNGLQYCTQSKGGRPFSEIAEFIEHRNEVKAEALRTIFRDLKEKHLSLCEVCPLNK